MLRMRKTDALEQDERWRVEEIELGDVTRALQEQPSSSSAMDADVDWDSDLVPLVPGSKPSAIGIQHRGRHTTFRVDGLVAFSTALQVAAAITLVFFLVGGPILCCLLTLTGFYLLVAYSTKAERQQERDDLAAMERDLNGSGGGGVVGVFHFVSGQCTRLYQRLVALKQSVVNYSLTVSIAESQAMLDLDEIVHGGRRRRRSSLLPCVESECVDDMRIDDDAVMENILVVDPEMTMTKHKDWRRRPMSKPFELRPVHLESLARRTNRSQSLPLPPMMPLEEEDLELRWVQPLNKKQDSMGSTESEEDEEDETETEPEAESSAMVEAEVEIEPVLPPLPIPVPVMLQEEDEEYASFSASSSDSEEDEEEESKEEEEVVASPRMSLLSSSMTMKTASAAASKAMHSAVKALTKLPNKLQIPVLLSRPLPRLVVHRAPSKMTPSQHVRRMLDETDKMEAELEEMLARNAAFFQAFEDSRESLELTRRAPDEDELSHNAFSSGEEEGEFWYEDTLGADFLDDMPPYLRNTESETEFPTEFEIENDSF